jgi:LPXTG-motif cell wall-anchored protein
MTHDSTKRRWTVAGLTSMAIGAVAIVAGLATPAAAHEGKEPADVPETSSQSCADLAEMFGIEGVQWTESKIEAESLPAEDESATYELVAGELTPGYEGDGPSVTIDMNVELKNFDWSSTVGIDAVYVKGGTMGSYFYGYQPEVAGYNEDDAGTVVGDGAESTGDVDLGTPPYGQAGKNQISHVTFCWDPDGGEEPCPDDQEPSLQSRTTDEGGDTQPTTPPECEEPTEPPCPDGEVSVSGMNGDGGHTQPTTPPECEEPTEPPCPDGEVSVSGMNGEGGQTQPTTPAECEPGGPPPTEPPPDTPDSSTTTVADNPVAPASTTTTVWDEPADDPLPNTGSNSTTMLLLGGLALVAAGGAAVAGNKWLRGA